MFYKEVRRRLPFGVAFCYLVSAFWCSLAVFVVSLALWALLLSALVHSPPLGVLLGALCGAMIVALVYFVVGHHVAGYLVMLLFGAVYGLNRWAWEAEWEWFDIGRPAHRVGWIAFWPIALFLACIGIPCLMVGLMVKMVVVWDWGFAGREREGIAPRISVPDHPYRAA